MTHEQQAEGRFHTTRTQGRLAGDLRLGRDARLTGSYQLVHSLGGNVHSFHISLIHSLGRRGSESPAFGLEQIPFERVLVMGRVFEDRNGDGRQDEGEPGIPGVEVAIDGDSREPVVTDVQGVYRSFLLPGRHFLRLLPASVPTEYALADAGRVEVEVMIDRTIEHDFPLMRLVGSVEGVVLEDRLKSGMPGVKVYLDDRTFTYTNEEGAFRFRSLPAGEYEVRLDLESLPFGYRSEGPISIPVRVEESGDGTLCTFRVFRPVSEFEF